MKRVASIIGLLLATTLTFDVAVAQENRAAQSSGEDMIVHSDQLKGSDVVNPQGEKLGTVNTIALDLSNGRISYVVVDPGMGHNLIPVPYNAFGVMQNQQLVLDVNKARLEQAPDYAKSSQPNWADHSFDQRVASFWGKAPAGLMKEGQATPGATPSEATPMGSQQQ